MSSFYECPACQFKASHLSVYLEHTRNCNALDQMHKDFQTQTNDLFIKNDFFKKNDEDFVMIGAYIRVMKDLKLRKIGLCRKHGKDPQIGCPATCPNFDEAFPCDEPCALQYIIELLCDIAHDLINEELK